MRVSFERIVCATDLSPLANHTLPYGIALAGLFGSKLYLCHVIDIPPIAAMYGEVHLDLARQQTQIEKFVHEQLESLMGSNSADIEIIIVNGRAPDEIARIASEKEADLVIAASHGRSGLKRLILGSVTERLLRTLNCPLMVIRRPENEVADHGYRAIKLKKILIGCDFSADSMLAFHYGLSLAQEFQSDLHLVHVVEPPLYKRLRDTEITLVEGTHQELETKLKEELVNMVPDEARNWCTIKTSLLAGDSDAGLTDYAASHDIDLIVLGIRGHGLMETLLVGSTTDRVIRQAPCPVLSVNPKSREV